MEHVPLQEQELEPKNESYRSKHFLCPALAGHTVFVVSVRNGSQLTGVPWDLRSAGHTSATHISSLKEILCVFKKNVIDYNTKLNRNRLLIMLSLTSHAYDAGSDSYTAVDGQVTTTEQAAGQASRAVRRVTAAEIRPWLFTRSPRFKHAHPALIMSCIAVVPYLGAPSPHGGR